MFEKALLKVDEFRSRFGRSPRILIAKLGQDGHDRGAKIIASGFSDLGFDVDLGPLFQTPEEAVRQAIDNDVHAMGISSQAAAHKTLVAKVFKALKKEKALDICVFVGGVIPPHDVKILEDLGVQSVFGPGTPIATCALEVLKKIEEGLS